MEDHAQVFWEGLLDNVGKVPAVVPVQKSPFLSTHSTCYRHKPALSLEL